jgi:hypothetical protein
MLPNRHRFCIVFLGRTAFVIGLVVVLCSKSLAAPSSPPDLIRLLEQTIGWYRQLSAPANTLWPKSRLHMTPAGLQVIIRFPVHPERATEIDTRLTHELLKALHRHPALEAAGSGTPDVKLRTDLSSSAIAN